MTRRVVEQFGLAATVPYVYSVVRVAVTLCQITLNTCFESDIRECR